MGYNEDANIKNINIIKSIMDYVYIELKETSQINSFKIYDDLSIDCTYIEFSRIIEELCSCNIFKNTEAHTLNMDSYIIFSITKKGYNLIDNLNDEKKFNKIKEFFLSNRVLTIGKILEIIVGAYFESII